MFLELLTSLFTDYTIRTVALGTAVLGIVSGAFGTFAMLRRQSLLGDAMSHAALPGVVLAFMLTRSKDPIVLIIGAAIAGIIAAWFFLQITNLTRIKQDAALGIILSVFFGFGLMLLSSLKNSGDARQAGLNDFLFGSAATLLERDVLVMGGFGLTALIILGLFWKEFKLLSFDPEFGATNGMPIKQLDMLLTGLIVIAIVLGLQAVGVVLMSAMVVAPAAAARQWTDRLSVMAVLSAVFGAIAGVSGALISSTGAGLSTGPVIVLCISTIVLISLFFAPNRGLLWSAIQQRRNRKNLQLGAVLANMYTLAQQHDDLTHPHELSVLRMMSTDRGVEHSLGVLIEEGKVEKLDKNHYALTQQGIPEAQSFAETGSFEEDEA